MASRVLLRRRAAQSLMTASLVGGVVFPSVALAEAPEQQSRKPIYDDIEPVLPRADTPVPSQSSLTPPTTQSKPRGPTPTDRLATEIGKARMFLYSYATKAEDGINATIDSAFHLEKSFTSTIASLAPSRESGEKLMPGVVYVLVASMAGSILTRNRNILLRASTPLALGIAAGWVVIPVTMGNVSELLWEYEQKVPAVADAHLKTRDSILKSWQFAKVHTEIGKKYVDEKVTVARDTMEDWVKKGK